MILVPGLLIDCAATRDVRYGMTRKLTPMLELELEREPVQLLDSPVVSTCPWGLPDWHWTFLVMGTRPPLSTVAQRQQILGGSDLMHGTDSLGQLT